MFPYFHTMLHSLCTSGGVAAINIPTLDKEFFRCSNEMRIRVPLIEDPLSQIDRSSTVWNAAVHDCHQCQLSMLSTLKTLLIEEVIGRSDG